MFDRSEVRRYQPIEYDEMPGEMVTAEDFDRMYEVITNYAPDSPPMTPVTVPVEQRVGDHIICPKHGPKFGFCEECVPGEQRETRDHEFCSDEKGSSRCDFYDHGTRCGLRESEHPEPKVEQRGDTPDGIGWCSSCDLVHKVQRPKCPKCGDWLH